MSSQHSFSEPTLDDGCSLDRSESLSDGESSTTIDMRERDVYPDSDSDTAGPSHADDTSPERAEGHAAFMDQPLPTEGHVPSKGHQVKAKTWFLTYPQCDGDARDVLCAIQAFRPTEWCIVAREKHEDGAPHLHVAVKFTETYATSDPTWADCFTGKHGNYQTVRSVLAVVKYVIKENQYVAAGIDPKLYVKKRARKQSSNWVRVVELLQSESLESIHAEHDALRPTIARSLRTLEQYSSWRRRSLARAGARIVRVVVLWGAPGVGKSRWAFGSDEPNNTWSCGEVNGPGRLWFTGYDVQRTIILDDLDFSKIAIPTLLKVFDRYRFPLYVHGGSTPAMYERVIVTCNHPLEYFYPSSVQAKALRRRYRSYYITANTDEPPPLLFKGDWTKPVTFDELWASDQVFKAPLAVSENLVE